MAQKKLLKKNSQHNLLKPLPPTASNDSIKEDITKTSVVASNNGRRLVCLNFTTPLHIGDSRADYTQSQTFIASDTLYAAIMQTWAMLGCTEWIDAVDTQYTNLPFVLSSAFPFTQDVQKETVYFLPRIRKGFDFTQHSMQRLAQEKRKAIKKIAWLDTRFFQQHLKHQNGASFQEKNLQGEYLAENILQCKQFMLSDLQPQVGISRIGEDSKPYYLERLRFREGSGLYFIVECDDITWLKIALALDVLQDEGLGTDRNTGNGRFKYTVSSENKVLSLINDLQNVKSPYTTNLSLWLPNDKNGLNTALADKNCAYELLERGGWVTTPSFATYKKKSCYFFAEGSIFKIEDKISGCAIDLQPEIMKGKQAVWRVGRSIMLPCNF